MRYKSSSLVNTILGWLLLLPACLAVGFFIWLPFVGLVRMSLHAIDLSQATSTYVGFTNFQTLLADAAFRSSIKVTLAIAVGKLLVATLGLWLGQQGARAYHSNLYKLSLSSCCLLGSTGLFYGTFQGAYILLLDKNINLGLFGSSTTALLKGILMEGLVLLPWAILCGYIIASLTDRGNLKYESKSTGFILGLIFFFAGGLVTFNLLSDRTMAGFIKTGLQGGVAAQELAAAAAVFLASPLLILGLLTWWIMDQRQPVITTSAGTNWTGQKQGSWLRYLPTALMVLLLVPTLALLISHQFSTGLSSIAVPFQKWTANGFAVAVVVIALQLFLGALTAYALNVLRPVGSRLAALFLTAPLFLFPFILTPFLRIMLFNLGLFNNRWAIALCLGVSPLSIFIFRLCLGNRQPSNWGVSVLLVLLISLAQSFSHFSFEQSVILTSDKLTLTAGLNDLGLFLEYGPTVALRAYGWSLSYLIPQVLLVFLFLVFLLPKLGLNSGTSAT